MCAPAASTPTGTSSAPSSAATWAPWEAQTSSTLWEPGRAMGHGGRTSPRTRRPSGPGWHPASHESRVVTPLGGVRGYGLPSASGELPEGDVPTEWRGESQNLLPSTALRPCPRTDVGASDEVLAPCWEQLSDAYGNPSTGWGRRNVVQGWNPGPSGPGGCQRLGCAWSQRPWPSKQDCQAARERLNVVVDVAEACPYLSSRHFLCPVPGEGRDQAANGIHIMYVGWRTAGGYGRVQLPGYRPGLAGMARTRPVHSNHSTTRLHGTARLAAWQTTRQHQ